ncbi:hypothetical protein SAMN05216391_1096 [Lachnospiraceae bacterium KHCPX20]|nr:hypothetical protein SAMN05216391_1096 [Lachnospiraceae bacterium KHCPX20]
MINKNSKLSESIYCDKYLSIVTKDLKTVLTKAYTADFLATLSGGRYTRLSENAISFLLSTVNLTFDDINSYKICYLREEDTVYISSHAMERMKKRLGWNQKAIYRMLPKVFHEGKVLDDLSGYRKAYFRRHKASVADVKVSDVLVYGHYIFLLDGNVLVTVYSMKGHEQLTSKYRPFGRENRRKSRRDCRMLLQNGLVNIA